MKNQKAVFSNLQCHGCIVSGKAVKKPIKFANTVLSLMLICLSGGPKILCSMLPIKEMDAMFLFSSKSLLLLIILQHFDAQYSGGSRVFEKGDAVCWPLWLPDEENS